MLEPEGTVEIKFRKKDLIKAMKRIDLTYKKLMERLGARVPGRHPPLVETSPNSYRLG